MTGRVTTTFVLLGLLGAAPATAQQEALKGLTEVEVLIETVDEQGWFCGVSQSVLFSAANKALLDNGVLRVEIIDRGAEWNRVRYTPERSGRSF